MRSLLVLLLASTACLGAKELPNFLVIMADDCTYNDLPVYGGRNARTPNIDRLAREGLVFERAYLAEAMCQPCRAELFTGQFPTRNGCAWNHSASRNSVTSMPQHLGRLGYRVGLAGKVHVKPKEAFPFEEVPGFDSNCVRNPTRKHVLSGLRDFMVQKGGNPFCLVVALVEPHVPWVMGDRSKYPTAELQLPPNLADTPRTRQDFASYLAEITYMDGQVGEILRVLQESGQAGNTLVLFTSEQGSQFPGCKWTNWDTGIHTGLIARWPGVITAGRRTRAMVHYADLVPTFLALAGEAPDPKGFDGMEFTKVLTTGADRHRDYAYGVHNNIPEGPPYPIRTVTDGEWRYIRNLLPEEIYIEKHLMGMKGTGVLNNPYWTTWVRDSWKNSHTYRVVRRYMRRPAEQLYHTASDPYEMKNLAEDPEHAAIKKRLSAELDRWMKQQGDPGAAQDTHEAHKAAREGRHLYGPAGTGG